MVTEHGNQAEQEYSVYKHTCPNGKVYIGITKQNVEERWGGGMSYQQNHYFFRDIVKYGWDNFRHEVLYNNLTEECAYETERQLIEKYNSTDPVYGYNISTGGKNPGEGVHHKKAAPSHSRPKGDLAYNAKRICQFDLEGNLLKTWGSGKSISSYFHMKNATGVSRSCKFKQIAYRGYIWLYAEESDRISEKIKALEECTARQYDSLVNWRRSTNKSGEFGNVKNAHNETNPKAIYQYTLEGEFVARWETAAEIVERYPETNALNIIKCCGFKHLASVGYLWVYAYESTRVTEKMHQFQQLEPKRRERIRNRLRKSA